MLNCSTASLDLVGCEPLEVCDAGLESLYTLLLSVRVGLLRGDSGGTLSLNGGVGLVVHRIAEVGGTCLSTRGYVSCGSRGVF